MNRYDRFVWIVSDSQATSSCKGSSVDFSGCYGPCEAVPLYRTKSAALWNPGRGSSWLALAVLAVLAARFIL